MSAARWRVAHRRRREVAQRVVVGALARHAAEAEPLRGQPAADRVGAPAALAAQRLVLLDVEADGRVRRVQLERGEPERGEVLGAVQRDHGAGRRVEQVDGQQQVLARRR
jgi:hypothetical protein